MVVHTTHTVRFVFEPNRVDDGRVVAGLVRLHEVVYIWVCITIYRLMQQGNVFSCLYGKIDGYWLVKLTTHCALNAIVGTGRPTKPERQILTTGRSKSHYEYI